MPELLEPLSWSSWSAALAGAPLALVDPWPWPLPLVERSPGGCRSLVLVLVLVELAAPRCGAVCCRSLLPVALVLVLVFAIVTGMPWSWSWSWPWVLVAHLSDDAVAAVVAVPRACRWLILILVRVLTAILSLSLAGCAWPCPHVPGGV